MDVVHWSKREMKRGKRKSKEREERVTDKKCYALVNSINPQLINARYAGLKIHNSQLR
jgi:hypothetical protein